MSPGPKLPLEMKGDDGGALRVYARAPGRVIVEAEGANGVCIANHLDRGAAIAVRDALDEWLRSNGGAGS